MEEPRVTIEYTSTVRVCISDIVSHLRRVDVEPGPVIHEILDQFESKIRQFPLSCQICPELLKIGCGKYREYNSSEGYRVLYSIENNLVTVHALLAHRQYIQQLLFKRLIQA
ncbi:type II toxin-antitoxin system RelE/ParE family toxin [Pectobacterium sp. CHL-2024]|uniref:type II toxin-antitoxin system RelE/ParE family toxin n=1 Tax=Pectobacterium sp. CHL-2024 TaxID=3377079 RepID=UPI003815D9A3